MFIVDAYYEEPPSEARKDGRTVMRFHPRLAPIKVAVQDTVPAILNELVEQGHFGVKTGRGFFNYAGREPRAVLKDRDQKLMQVKQLLAKLFASNAA